MLTALLAVLPVFAVIAAGYLAGRLGWLRSATGVELNRFVVWLGLPALMFQVLAEADWAVLWQPGYLLSWGLGGFGVLLVTVVWRVRQGQALQRAALDGLSASYANVGFLGFSLCSAVFGPRSLGLVSLSAVLAIAVQFSLTITLAEIGSQAGQQAGLRPLRLARNVGTTVFRNPIVLAPLLGGIWSGLGVPLPLPFASFLHLMGASAGPCALVAIGLFFADRPTAQLAASSVLVPVWISLAKLVGQPLLTWVLAVAVFRLPPFAAEVAVVTAALPTGTGSFLLAERYRGDLDLISRCVLYSTVASVVTLTALLMLLQHLSPGAGTIS